MINTNEVLSLKDYINGYNSIENNVRTETFCSLMKNVSEAIEKEDRRIIRINLEEIRINQTTGDIILPDSLFSANDLDKTIAGFNTGISVVADRKSTKEHKRVAFALMVLGWYCNPDKSSISNDMDVLENFEGYMNSVPTWLRNHFIDIFKNMNYDESFDEYYDKNYVNVLKNKIKEAFLMYNLNDGQANKMYDLINRKATINYADEKISATGEEQVLSSLDSIISEFKSKFNDIDAVNISNNYLPNESGAGQTQGLARVRFDESLPKYVPPVDPLFKEAASSYVIIIAGVLALISIVSVITFSILKGINL